MTTKLSYCFYCNNDLVHPVQHEDLDWDDTDFPLKSFDYCGLCKRGLEHTVAEHAERWKESTAREYRRSQALEKAARFTYDYDRDVSIDID